MTADTDDTWHPGQILEPGRPCPDRLRQQIRDAIRAGLEEHADRTKLIAQRQEDRK